MEGSHLLVNTWASDYDEGNRMLSGYFALRSAVRNPQDKFLSHHRLVMKLYLIFISSLFLIFNLVLLIPRHNSNVEASYVPTFHVLTIISFILFLLFFFYYWLLLLKWKKRTQFRMDENLKEIGIMLTKPELKLLIRREDSVFKEISLQVSPFIMIVWIILVYFGVIF